MSRNDCPLLQIYFHKDTIHKIVNFSYRSCLQQPTYKLLKRNLIVSYLHETFTKYEDKIENQCINVLNTHFSGNCKLASNLSCEVTASTFLLGCFKQFMLQTWYCCFCKLPNKLGVNLHLCIHSLTKSSNFT